MVWLKNDGSLPKSVYMSGTFRMCQFSRFSDEAGALALMCKFTYVKKDDFLGHYR